jgi:hypothetical protein
VGEIDQLWQRPLEHHDLHLLLLGVPEDADAHLDGHAVEAELGDLISGNGVEGSGGARMLPWQTSAPVLNERTCAASQNPESLYGWGLAGQAGVYSA